LRDWVADVATALAPIGDQLYHKIVPTDYLQTEDTTVTVLDERGGGCKGRLWAYLNPLTKQVVLDATRTHERARPAAILSTSEASSKPTRGRAMTGCISAGTSWKLACLGACAPGLCRCVHDRHARGGDRKHSSAKTIVIVGIQREHSMSAQILARANPEGAADSSRDLNAAGGPAENPSSKLIGRRVLAAGSVARASVDDSCTTTCEHVGVRSGRG
jgi:hypothetical protein